MSIPTHPTDFYKEAFKRNDGLVSENVQEKLKNVHIAIPGMGGVGGIHSTTLARLGVGVFTLADGDHYELVNFNRQAGATISTLGASKVETMKKMVLDINPFAAIRSFGLVTPENIDSFLEGVDIVVDGMDFFEFDIRRLIFNKAREKGIPVITAAPIGFGSSVIIFTKESMSFDDYFAVHETMSKHEKLASFGIGLSPSLLHRKYYKPKTLNLQDEQAPSSVLGTLAAANWVAVEVYKLVSGVPVDVAPKSTQFDPYVKKVKKVHLRFGNRNILQRFKRWYFLRLLTKKSK